MIATDSTPSLRLSSMDAGMGASLTARGEGVMAAAGRLAKAAAPVMKLLASQISEHGEADFDQAAAIEVGTDTYEHACHVLARVLVAHSQRIANAAKFKTPKQ